MVWISSQALAVLICMRGVSECPFSNLFSECFSSAVPGWFGPREPDTW